jgi:hypothetical protein
MKALARQSTRDIAFVARVLLMVTVALLIPSRTSCAQGERVDARSKECRQLLKKQVSQLTDEQLRILKSCFEPLERRKKEKAESVDQLLAPAERKAPLRIYGK